MLENQTEHVREIIIMAILSFLSGIVRVCTDSVNHSEKILSVKGMKRVFTSLMASTFTGTCVGMLTHTAVTDPVVHSAVVSISAFLGQLLLVAIARFVAKQAMGKYWFK